MSRLTKLARIYRAVSYLEKNAVSMSAVQKAVGATAGRATQAEAKAVARGVLSHESVDAQKIIASKQARIKELRSDMATVPSAERPAIKDEISKLRSEMVPHQQVINKDFRNIYRSARGKGSVSESQLLNRAAINTDETLLKLRKEQRALQKQLGGASPEQQKAIKEEMSKLQQQQSARVKEVNKNFQAGDQATIDRASQRVQATGQKPRSAELNQWGEATPQGSFVEGQAINQGSLANDYKNLLKNKDIKLQAEAITGGTADAQTMQAFKSYQRNNPTGTAQEFLAQSKIQSQMRNNMGSTGREAGGMFGADTGSKTVKGVAQDLQYGKGQYAFGQEMQNAQNAMNKQYSKYVSSVPEKTMPIDPQQFAFQQAQQQQQFAQQQFARQNQQAITQNAQQLVQSGQAANMEAAMTQARANFKPPTQSPLQNVPLTPDQQLAFKYTGNVQGTVDPRFVQGGASVTATPLQAQQQNIIFDQSKNLKGKELNQFNQATQANSLNQNQVRQNTINTQNQATSQQRSMSAAGPQNQQASGNMFGGYGVPLAVGAGVLGAGYLYANSGNSQQPTPYQGGS